MNLPTSADREQVEAERQELKKRSEQLKDDLENLHNEIGRIGKEVSCYACFYFINRAIRCKLNKSSSSR